MTIFNTKAPACVYVVDGIQIFVCILFLHDNFKLNLSIQAEAFGPSLGVCGGWYFQYLYVY